MRSGAKVRIDKVRTDDLLEYARRFSAPDYRGLCPVTPQRALAHAHNPLADPGDIALLVAYRGDEVIGYLGIVPGAWAGDGEAGKVYWLTALYVAPRHARTVGALIVLQAMKLGYDLITS